MVVLGVTGMIGLMIGSVFTLADYHCLSSHNIGISVLFKLASIGRLPFALCLLKRVDITRILNFNTYHVVQDSERVQIKPQHFLACRDVKYRYMFNPQPVKFVKKKV